jgi:hypothetical protein
MPLLKEKHGVSGSLHFNQPEVLMLEDATSFALRGWSFRIVSRWMSKAAN